MTLLSIHHIQLAIPQGGEELAREFYSGILELSEVAKPAHLAVRGGLWFEDENLRLHLGVDPDFKSAKKAHPAFIVSDLDALVSKCLAAYVEVVNDQPLAGFNRIYIYDPFGNRIELMQPIRLEQ